MSRVIARSCLPFFCEAAFTSPGRLTLVLSGGASALLVGGVCAAADAATARLSSNALNMGPPLSLLLESRAERLQTALRQGECSCVPPTAESCMPVLRPSQ